MKVELPLEQMSVAEKLEAMETLWADLSRLSPDEAVPAWHGSVLAERERALSCIDSEVQHAMRQWWPP